MSLTQTIETIKADLESKGLWSAAALPALPSDFDGSAVDEKTATAMDGIGLARLVDHTVLKAETTPEQIDKLCAEAIEYDFAAVCVNGGYVRRCAENLAGSNVRLAAVAGFPLGTNTTATKAAEARELVAAGAQEIDMVLAVGRLKTGDLEYVKKDVAAVVEAAGAAWVKVILETCLLSDEEKIAASLLCQAAGAAFVKTSTGFNSAGATPEDVALMRQTVGARTGVKAAGGIRDAASARAMVIAGANRLGCSAGVAIATDTVANSSY